VRRIGISLAVILLAFPGIAPAGTICKDSPRVTGACFTVHGRLFAANGTPTFRIWRVGTKRIIGVDSADGDLESGGLPDSVEKLVEPDAFKVDVYGDYRVCPFTKDRPGRMQIVCIDDASRLVAQPR
jgi:hypothetical protein